MRHYKTLTWNDRLKIEALHKIGVSPKRIAEELGFHFVTIYRELKRGQYEHLNGDDWTTEIRYSPEKSEEKKQSYLRAKGADLKIGKNREYAEFLEYMIGVKKYSPDAALFAARKEGKCKDTEITRTTLYRYIDQGVFLSISNKDLPIKKNKRRKKKSKRAAKTPCGKSIEKRPAEVKMRKVFGHWEMDSVEGAKKDKEILLVLTERKTRDELVRKMKDKTAKSVVKALDAIEREFGTSLFHQIFRTITVDNGAEFSDAAGMEKSIKPNKKRTQIYYCHPYSYFERGSNENQNRLIRRFYPKGCHFKNATKEDIQNVENWMNNYPRKILNWKTPAELFQENLREIIEK